MYLVVFCDSESSLVINKIPGTQFESLNYNRVYTNCKCAKIAKLLETV